MSPVESWWFDRSAAVWRYGDSPGSSAAVEWDDSGKGGWAARASHGGRAMDAGRHEDRLRAMEAARGALEKMRRGEI